jgi:imidazole glycerol-phosphate synthase subunit HisF
MFRPRVIPVLLLKAKGLVKSQNFDRYRYIGDPINTVKIFNDLEADELIFLDITATKEGRTISLDLVKDIGDEAYMPFAVGGGIHRVEEIGQLISAGAEKVVLNTATANNPALIGEAAKLFGSQSIVVSIDVKKKWLGKYQVFACSGSKGIKTALIDYVKEVEAAGAGEIMINSIDRDGMMNGYDLELIGSVAEAVSIPVIACGGAGKIEDLAQAVLKGGASAAAAGSMFVFHGPRRAVLINYPERKELLTIFNK